MYCGDRRSVRTHNRFDKICRKNKTFRQKPFSIVVLFVNRVVRARGTRDVCLPPTHKARVKRRCICVYQLIGTPPPPDNEEALADNRLPIISVLLFGQVLNWPRALGETRAAFSCSTRPTDGGPAAGNPTERTTRNNTRAQQPRSVRRVRARFSTQHVSRGFQTYRLRSRR